jgi:hypothetical protein
VEIVEDTNGKSLVKINDIRFKGKRSVDWGEVKEYLYDILDKKRNEQPVGVIDFTWQKPIPFRENST